MKNNMKLSVVLATWNEEENIKRCLESVKSIADEIIIVDEHSTDRTREIAERFRAKVFLEPHHDIFHITKQKALEKARGKWILQMDADEVISKELAEEIRQVTEGKKIEIIPEKKELFMDHQKIIEARDGKIGKDKDDVVGYFIPRMNMFLGKPLIYGGVYPDGVIRLVRKGFANFPQKSVHEQIELNGRVGWLNESLLHYDSPTLSKYFKRLNRYTDLHANELRRKNVAKNVIGFLKYIFIKPIYTFLNIFIRHRGFIDGVNGFIWAFFSSLHFPVAYFKYMTDNKHEL